MKVPKKTPELALYRSMSSEESLAEIAAALQRLSPGPAQTPDFKAAEAFKWHATPDRLEPIVHVNRIGLDLLVGIDRARDTLLQNTWVFARGNKANNALLWGARGMGKSSLVKAVHARVAERQPELKLIEILREDIASVGRLLPLLSRAAGRFVLFCDDLSFTQEDVQYKSLKAVLDGGIEGRPPNVVFYATSNRRHLMPRDMIENERSTAINPSEAAEEKISLSDRFGLWLGFHPCSQNDYFEMIRRYARAFDLKQDQQELRRAAIEWQQTRGARSGRVAWQFIVDLAGREGKTIHG